MILEPVRQRGNRSAIISTKSFPPPTKGWYALENIAAGKPGIAFVLENYFPRADTVDLRFGWEQHSDTTETTAVQTIMSLNAQNGQNAMFSVANGTVYDVTSSSAAATTVTGLTNSKIESVNFSTSGGNFLFCVNGEDEAFYYDGTNWTVPSITGVLSDTFSHVMVFKSRLYFVIKDSLSFGFLPSDSIAGAADYFPLGNVFSMGGHLLSMMSWTIDGGSGPDDHAVFVTSEGQIAIYQGSDPTDPNDWALIGVYTVPTPIGKRCLLKVGGDIYIITTEGVLPLSKSLILDKAAVNNFAMTKNISPAMNKLARLYQDNFGWQIIAYPRGTMAIVNVPIDEGRLQHQLVMNTITGAWCRFTNQNANCWHVFEDRLFFGGNDGVVYEADCAASDGGAAIVGDMRLYDDSFGAGSVLKQFKMVRVNIYSDGRSSPLVGLNIDYEDRPPNGTVQNAVSDVILWDQFNWDEANWPADRVLFNSWQGLTERPGYTAALRLKVSALGTGSPILLQVNGFDVTFERGGTL